MRRKVTPESDERRARAGADPRTLAGQLMDLLESARPLPILRQQVRVDKDGVYDLVAAMRDAAPYGLPRRTALHSLLEAAEAVEDAARNAMPVPLTDDVRLPQARVDELLRGLRAAGAYSG
jgi:hypothetical protein